MRHELGPESAFSGVDDSMARARTLHLAEGILIGLRRCSPEQAITELVSAGRDAGLSTYALARGLVAAAGGRDGIASDPAARVAEHRWGALFPSPPRHLTNEKPSSSSTTTTNMA
jgi:hypothetical protein